MTALKRSLRRAGLLSGLFALAARPLAADDGWGRDTRKTTVLVTRAECCPEAAWPEAEKRVARELELAGVNVVTVRGRPDAGPVEEVLRQTVSRERAAAAITLISSGEAEVTLALATRDEDTDAVSYRILSLDIAPDDDNAEIAALRSLEAVRASILETTAEEISPPEVDEEISPPEVEGTEPGAPVSAPAAEESPEPSPAAAGPKRTAKPRRWRLDAAFLGQWAPGGIGLRGAVGADAVWITPLPLSLGVSGRVTVVGRDISGDNAAATFDMAFARARVAWMPRPLGILQPSLGAAVVVGFVWTRGESETVEALRTEHVTLFYAGGFAEAAFVLGPRVAIPLAVDVGVLPPGISVRFGGETVSKLRMPLIEASLGVALMLG
jgi:hypothetical protein